MAHLEGLSQDEIIRLCASLGVPVPVGTTSGREHLAWAKERALEYVDAGDLTHAMASLISDLNKHPDTAEHPGLLLGSMARRADRARRLLASGHLNTAEEMRHHIEGYE